mmetsp:Transcript_50906/g.91646  ORF Transcript_50906/g.91646 Transcript_50906/m.91646 type:complete len:234 (-) Transcript_50906:2348-3049(-)
MPPGSGGGGGMSNPPPPLLPVPPILPGSSEEPPGVPIGVFPFGVPSGVWSKRPGSKELPPGVPIGVSNVPFPRAEFTGDLPWMLPPFMGGTPGAPRAAGRGGGGAPSGRPWPLAVRNAGIPGIELIPVPPAGPSIGKNEGRDTGAFAGGGGGGALFGGCLGATRGTAGFGGGFLRNFSSDSALGPILRMRLLRKSPPTRRRRISNFRSSTMVITAQRITSRTPKVIPSAMVTA